MMIDKKDISKHIQMIRTDDGKRYFTWYNSDIKSYDDFKNTFIYRKRVMKHQITQKIFRWILKRLAYYLAKRSNYKHSERADVKQYYLELIYNKEGYSNDITKHQSLEKCYYCLKFSKFSFYGYSEYDVYLAFIRRIIIVPVAFPYC